MSAECDAGSGDSYGLTLIGSEDDVVERHLRRIKGLSARLWKILRREIKWARWSEVDRQRYPPPEFKQPRMATTLALLGPRGSGKSTCLVDLLQRLSDEEYEGRLKAGAAESVRCVSGFLVVRQPVDCTLGPPDVPLGLSVLMKLRALVGLDEGSEAEWPCEGRSAPDPRVEAEERAFKAMREAYMLSLSTAGRVLEATSASGSHYARQASFATASALALPDRVADWLQLAVQRLPADVEGFILALDDVDLALDGLLGLVNSLLDELHQPRLILVLAADLDRLEFRVADGIGESRSGRGRAGAIPEREFLDRIALAAARDLVYKALPQRNREWLRPWKEDERWTFPPSPAPMFPEESSLKDLLLRHADWGVPARNPSLLPCFPRGLENLWFALRGIDDGAEVSGGSRGMLDSIEEYLEFLGEARREHELGRRIGGRPASTWARHLVWPERELGGAQWVRLVRSALEGGPLLGLQATSDALPLPDDPASAALWTEILLDLALEAGDILPSEVILRISGLRELLGQAQIMTDFHRDEIKEELRHARGSILAKLAWTRLDVTLDRRGVVPEEFDAQIGLKPLREAQERGRNAWPALLIEGLLLRRSDILTERQRAYDDGGAPVVIGDLLPKKVRPLVAFLDSLCKAPWTQLSNAKLRRSMRTNVLLAAGLTHAAYVDAIDEAFKVLERRGVVKGSERCAPTDAWSMWLDSMYGRESTPIAEWPNQTVELRFHALALDPAAVRTAKAGQRRLRRLGKRDLRDGDAAKLDWEYVFAPYNELVRCLNAYTSSGAFRNLVDPSFAGASS